MKFFAIGLTIQAARFWLDFEFTPFIWQFRFERIGKGIGFLAFGPFCLDWGRHVDHSI